MESVLYGNDYRAMAVAHRQIKRVAAMIAPPVIVPRVYEQFVGNVFAHPDLADMPQVRALLPHRRKARNDKLARGKGMQPYPVYVATFPDGTTQRLSFWSHAGKDFDYAAGYNVSMICGRAVPESGYVEHNGARYDDPFFSSPPAAHKARKESAATRLAAIVRALNEGEIDAALLMAKNATTGRV